MATQKTPTKAPPVAAPKTATKPAAPAKKPAAPAKKPAASATKPAASAKKVAASAKKLAAPSPKSSAPKKAAAPATEPNQASAKQPTAAPTSSPLVVGAKAPELSLPDETGTVRTLREFAGKPLVLYFYPKDDTPGCTREACAFQENLGALTKAGVAVVGVSRDSAAAHVRFKKKYGLAFPLLVDADAALHRAYGAFGMKTLYGRTSEGALRTTVIIDAKGRIHRVFEKVKVDGHVDAVRAALPLAWISRLPPPRCRIPRAFSAIWAPSYSPWPCQGSVRRSPPRARNPVGLRHLSVVRREIHA